MNTVKTLAAATIGSIAIMGATGAAVADYCPPAYKYVNKQVKFCKKWGYSYGHKTCIRWGYKTVRVKVRVY